MLLDTSGLSCLQYKTEPLHTQALGQQTHGDPSTLISQSIYNTNNSKPEMPQMELKNCIYLEINY